MRIVTKNISKNKKLRKIYKYRYLYAMLIPFLLYYILFVFRPMGGMVIAFKDYSVYKGIMESPWVGLKHFKDFFSGEYVGRVFKNTIMISLYQLAFGFPLPIVFALLLNEISFKKYKGLIQTMSYLPYFISTVVIAGMVTLFLAPTNGIVNILIDMFGGKKIYFLNRI